MSEPVFLRDTRGLSLDEIVALTGASAPEGPVRARHIVNVAPLDRASPSDIAFFDAKRFSGAAARTHAGICLTSAALAKELPSRVTVLVVREPFRAFVQVART